MMSVVKEQLIKQNKLLENQIRTLVGELEKHKFNPKAKLSEEMIIKPVAEAEADAASEGIQKITVSEVPSSAPPASKQPTKSVQKKAAPPAEDKPIDISRLDLRIGQIVDVKLHPDADSLYVESIKCGDENARTVISGLVKHVPIEEMQDRKVVLLCNLKPAKMRGILSEAMVMCASTPDKVELIVPPESSSPGDRVVFEGFEGEPDAQLNPKKKIWEQVSVDIKTNEEGVAVYKGVSFKLKGKEGIFKSSLKNVPIK